MKPFLLTAVLVVMTVGTLQRPAQAETGHEGWLRYAYLEEAEQKQYQTLPASVVALGGQTVLKTAQAEMVRGLKGMLGRTLRAGASLPKEPAIILATLPALHGPAPNLKPPQPLDNDGFWLTSAQIQGQDCLVIASGSERGVLYGVFALLRIIAVGGSVAKLNVVERPAAPIRWVDQWDNLDGSIERGYAGPSIFFEKNAVRTDLTRSGEYARLLASIGINGCTINNVNANPRVLDDSFLPQLARVAETFRPWGVRLSVSVDLSSPKVLGGLDTFDPLDQKVIDWWQQKVDQIYRAVPDFGGFVVKADSEGRLGPSSYGRTPADAANLLARALKPYDGVLFYRAFVYDHHLDWNNPKADRARAAYDIFHPLDGKFADNVIIQIKHGPIDFQVREPVSSLFGGLEKTNTAIELQITQEYNGQQRHLCYLAPMWQEVLDFDLKVNGGPSKVKDILSGSRFHRPLGGYVGVVNVGMDENWLGHPLAMANLYGYGRLAWDSDITAKSAAEEWTRLTFGNSPLVVKTISDMQLASWPTYEKYTGPLGLQTLTNIVGPHYGPGVDASERNGWGQWHRADHDGVGMDRSAATGTGYAGQYAPAVAKVYESVGSTPDNLLLFFHHVPYKYVLHSGKTVIQQIYDLHYEGADRAAEFVHQWKTLKDHIDEQRYAAVLARLEYQAGHAIVWRDAVCNWFFTASEIPDSQGRVGHYPDRVEAEGMQLQGYTPYNVSPRENASNGKGTECEAAPCTARFSFDRVAGWYELDVEYFDQFNGQSRFRVYVRDQLVDEWTANDHFPARRPDGDSSTRRRIPGLALRPGDEIRIEGFPDGEEAAPLDYVEIMGGAK